MKKLFTLRNLLYPIILFVSMLPVTGIAQVSLHYWDFNSGATATANAKWVSPVAATQTIGGGSITHNFTKTENFAGSTVDAAGFTSTAGASFAPLDLANNGNSLIITAPTTGYNNIRLTYASNGSSTGFTTHTIDYSIDGTTFSNLTTFTGRNNTTFTLLTSDFSAITSANNNSSFKIRITVLGATGSSGNNRFDNVRVTGTAITGTTNPTVNLSVSSPTGTEAVVTPITVTVTANPAVTTTQTVKLTVTGNGSSDITTGDYSLNGLTTNTVTITIPDGGTTGTATFTVVDDASVEGTETATLTISNPSSGIIIGTNTQNITITDNDIAPPAAIVINEVYGGGGNNGSTYRYDFIELYNPTNSAVSLTGWSVQYNSSAGTGTWFVTPLSGSIPAHGYYLIQEAIGAGGTTDLPSPVDATGTISMAAGAGKVALVFGTTALTGQNPLSTSIIDKVAYGTVTGGGFEGAGSAPAPSATTSIQRSPIGFDSDNNNTDFVLLNPPTPKNSVTDVTAPTVISVFPADNATGVMTSFTATITFSENIQKGTGNITLKKADGTTVRTIDITTSDVTVSGTSASFNINSLLFNSGYYFEISSGAFKDGSENNFAGITGSSAWNFTTSDTPPAGTLGTTYNFNACSGNLPDGFTQYSVVGPQIWSCTSFGIDATHTASGSAPNGLQINGFNQVNVANEDWLISPSYNLTGTSFPLLSFWSRTAFTGATLQLKVSTNYSGTGDPNLATWTDLNGKFPAQVSDIWKLSDNINLTNYKSANTYFAFVYTSTTEDGARWTLDDITVTNSLTPPPPSLTTSATDIQYTFVANGATSDKTFTFIGNDLTGDVTLTSTGAFTLSKDGTTFSSSITYTLAEANNIPETVYVRFAPNQNNQTFAGTVTISTPGLTNTVINLNGSSIDPATTLEVVNWNIEWFSSPTFGPTNDAQQEQNVKTIMQNIGADIFGLVEVVDEAALAALVAQMPGYSYVISNYGSHTNTCVNPASALADAQKLAFVYKTALFTNVTTTALLSSGINTCADAASTSYNNWASGRYPFMMSADVTLNCVTKNVKFILVHAKANTAPTATSYARRKAGADELHALLETPAFASENIIILGDYNDDLDQSITTGFTTTSWSAFTTDAADFPALTLPLSLAGKKSTVSYNDVIDHVIISNDLQPYYLPGSASILTDVSSLVTKYGTTTTDHYPVFTRYIFPNTTAPTVTSCTAEVTYCDNATDTYTVPAFIATDDCGDNISYSYVITGATERSGTGNNASGNFNVGTSTVVFTGTDTWGNSATCSTTVIVQQSYTYYVDADSDGFGTGQVVLLCFSTAPAGYSTNNTDCNDGDGTVHEPQTYYVDGDNDGYGSTATATFCSSTAPAGFSTNNTDCNDNDARVHTPQPYYLDADNDGYGFGSVVILCSVTAPAGYSVNNYDCDDNDKGKKRVIVCHNGRPLCIDENALKGHLKHGDQLGECTSIITSARTTNNGIASAESVAVTHPKNSISAGLLNLSNYPNPFSSSTVISYYVPVDSKVSLKIYNGFGQAITTLFEGDKKAGNYTINYNGSKLTNGFYYCRLTAVSKSEQFVKSIKLSVGK